MKKWLTLFFWFTGVIFALCLGLILVVYLFLRTPAGSKFVLKKVQQVVAQKGGTLEFSEGSIHPFSSIDFENLKLVQGVGVDRTEIQVASIHIQYSFSIFSRLLDIKQMSFSRPILHIHRSLVSTDSSGSGSVRENRSGLPPFQILIRQFSVDQLALDFTQENSDLQFKFQCQNLSLRFSFTGTPQMLSSVGDLHLKDNAKIGLWVTNGFQKTQIQARVSAQANWDFNFLSQDSKWIYKIAPSNFKLAIPELFFNQGSPSGTSKITLDNFQWSTQAQLLAKTEKIFQWDKKSLEDFYLESKVDSNSVVWEENQASERRIVRAGPQKVTLKATLSDQITFQLDQTILSLFSKKLSPQPMTFKVNSFNKMTRDFNQFDSKTSLTLNTSPFADLTLQARTGPDLDLEGKLKLFLNKPFAPRSVGPLLVQGDFHSHIYKKLSSFLDIRPKTLSQSPMEGDLKISMDQNRKSRANIWFHPFLLQTHLRWDQGIGKVDFNAGTSRFFTPLLKKPWKLDLGSKATWNSHTHQVDLDGVLKIQNQEALYLQSHSRIDSKDLESDSTLKFTSNSYLEGLLPSREMSAVGNWIAKMHLGLKVKFPQSQTPHFFEESIITANATTTLAQQPLTPTEKPLILLDPMTFDHHLELSKGKGTFDFSGSIPSLEIRKFGKVLNTRFHSSVSCPDSSFSKAFELTFKMSQGQVFPNNDITQMKEYENYPLEGINLTLVASRQAQGHFTLKEFSAGLNHSMITLSAEATGNTKSRNFQTQGQFIAEIPDDFPPIQGQKLHGRIEFPWNVSIRRGTDIGLSGRMSILNMDWSRKSLSLQRISGIIPVSEHLIWDGKKIRFSHLITQNPFERVDYERLQPMIDDSEQLDIGVIRFEEKIYGPFQGFFSMHQNMIFAHKFSFYLGSGQGNGEMFFDAYPSNLRLGILSRLTGLSLPEIIPQKYLVKAPKEDQPLSGRSGMVIHVNNGVIDGRLDINEIGRDQLLTLINIVDPTYVNEQLNNVRFALGIAYPTMVSMSFQKGFMDMGVQLGGTLPQEFHLVGIPVSTWVSGTTSGLIKKSQKGTLE